MGMRTYVVVADMGEAEVVAETEYPATVWEGFGYQGFHHVQLCTLLSLLKSGTPDADFSQYLDRIQVLGAHTEDRPLLAVAVPELAAEVSKVAQFDDDEFELLATAWAATEEFDGWSDADLRDLLRELGDLAETASLQNKCLMIWQSTH